MNETTETLTLERTYAASPEQVFNAWTQIDVLRRWFGCAPDQLWDVHIWDARVGGGIHVSMDFDGDPFEVRGEFLVVEPPHKLKYRWTDDEFVDVTIEPHDSGSRVYLAHTFPTGRGARPILTAGWTSALERLEHIR